MSDALMSDALMGDAFMGDAIDQIGILTYKIILPLYYDSITSTDIPQTGSLFSNISN